ncbi:hypothetical protein HETIRDRAFT_313578 [Heterobasidion irregulare TC 32-1]|uniref:Uncharacterized protein n=1 Tax=Heterobasidion irregulare (strain TC 32-1) TaxID=747525 RepID=W4KE34_HETIT|nr:uncharacterized protein HETIRDRAFT_313578 [Heterobasidion irregulare TC 32-1]ETW83580.1 hypothetical protein HETIRDRAFT_313578 [Heterobasidion irregulare TC 32-1]
MATPSLAHLDDEVFTYSHKKMDEAVLKQIAFCFGTVPQCPPHDVLLSTIIEKCPELYQDSLDEAYLGRINKLLVEYTQLGSMLEDCWEKQSFESIRDLEILWPEREVRYTNYDMDDNSVVPRALSEKGKCVFSYFGTVTELGWRRTFRGNAHKALWRYIVHHQSHSDRAQSPYTQYASII